MKLNKTNWTKEDYDKFIEYLYSLKDEKYLEFQSKLICEEINIIGVRIPKLKEIAKEIVKGNYLEFIKLSHDDLYEEKTIPFLKKNNLDKWTQNKAISKIKDSKRVAKEEKLKIDKLKK